MEKIKINYDRTYSSKYNRDYYRGKSFHYAGRWKLGARYVSDEFNSDFIVYDEVMLICKKSHTATPGNEPKDIYELEDGLLGLNSEYWDVVMPALYGGSKYIVIGLEQEKGHSTIHGMSQNAITIELDALDEAIRDNVERIDSDIAQKWSSINQRADEISATVAENRRISEEEDRRLQANITINAEAIATEVSDRTIKEGEIVADYNSKFTQTAQEIATEVSAREAAIAGVTADYNSKISQTAQEIRAEVNEHVENLEGEISDTNSLLSQTADQIRAEVSSTRTDLEGQIETAKAEIKVTTDAITSTVEANKQIADGQYTQLNSKIDQTAESITSTVEAYKEELDGTISDNYSELKQTANEISSTVAANKIDADNKITTVQSNLTQTATDIRAEVTANKQETDNAIEDLSSSLTLTAEEIRSEVNSHVETLEGEIADTNSNISQTASAIRAEVASTKTNLEGQISDAKAEIKMTTDEISATVEANKQSAEGAIENVNTRITQTADSITSTVNSYKEELDGKISSNFSELKQDINGLSSTVTSNKQETDGAIENLSSNLTQTAAAIRSEVAAAVQDINGEIEETNSTITQTAAEINSNVSALSGRVTTAESNITQNANAITLEVEARQGLEESVAGQLSVHQGLIDSLQQQVDGAIDMHFYPGVPTLNNVPANQWTTDELKNKHLGDLYYDKDTGYAYRFVKDSGVYKWIQIQDDAIAKALADAAKAQATADGKMTIFYSQPSTYRIWDLWITEVAHTGDTGDKKDCIIRCSTANRDNNYVETDWVLVSDIANASKVKAAFSILADMIDSTVAEYTSDNELVPGSLYSHILQSRDQISLKIGTAKNEAITNATGQVNGVKQNLLDTGIDITNKKIEMTADNIVLKNNSGTRSLSITNGSDGKPIIAASNLQLDGVLSIGDWNNGKMDLEAYARSKADDAKNSAISTAADDATNKANNAQSNAEANAAADATAKANAARANAEAAAKADLATKLGYDSYEAMVIAAQNGNTIINGGYLRTNLIDTDALYVKHLNGADGTFTGALNAATGSFSGEVTASKFTISNDATVSGLKVSQVNGAASSSDLATTNNNVTAAKNRADSAYALAQQAGTAAGDAETNAKNDLAKRLGYASYDDMVEKAQAGKTIIDGAYIRTGLINADALQVKAANVTGTLAIGNIPDLSSKYLTEHQSLAGYMNESTYIQGGFIKTSYINTSAITIGSGQVTGLGSLATKNKVSATSDVTGLASVATSGSYNDLNGKPTIPDVSNLADRDVFAQKLGYTNYADLVAKAAAGSTIIDGGHIRTSLIETSAITIGSGQVTGLGSLATKNSVSATGGDITGLGSLATKNTVSATTDVTGLGSLATKNTVSASTDVTGLATVATSGNYNHLSNRPTIPDVSNLADRDIFAQKLGYADYDALVAAAADGQTLIYGGLIRTSLIDADALNVKAANITGQLTASQINTSGLTITASQVSDLSSQGFMKDTTYISGGKIKTQYIDASALTISGSQISGTLAEGNIPTLSQSKISNLSTDLTNVRNTANTASTNASNAITTANSAASTASGAVSALNSSKDAIADHFGYADYDTMIAAAKAGGATFVQGGYLNTNLINADAVVTNYLSAHKITADQINTNGLVIGSGQVSGLGSLATKNTVSASTDVTGLGSLATKNNIGTSDLDSTIISGGYIKTSLINASAIVIGSGQVTGLGSLATKDSVSASTDVTGLGSLATKNTVSASTDITGLASVATSGSYNSLSDKPTIPDVSNLADRDVFAQKLGYTNYAALVTAASNNQTIISGGLIRTSLIDVDTLVVKHLNGADGTFTGTVSAGTISGGSININDKFIVNSNGEMTSTAASITGTINANAGRIDGQLIIGSGGSIISTNNREESPWASDTVHITANGISLDYSSSASATRSYRCDIVGPGITFWDVGSGGVSKLNITSANITRLYGYGAGEFNYTVPWTEDVQYIEVVNSMPLAPSSDTLYFVTS